MKNQQIPHPRLIDCKCVVYNPISTPLQSILTNRLQIADILDYILGCVGKSEIWQSTFSVSEEFLRRIFHIRESGTISKATVILDHKACRKILNLWQFISNAFDNAYMSDNHSKILLLKSESGHKISIITSQNLTRGNRYESTIITSDDKIFDSLLEDFEKITQYHSIPLDDLLGRSSQAD